MAEARIDAETRTEFGKGAARRTRRAGKIPAVLYGHGTDPQHLSLPVAGVRARRPRAGPQRRAHAEHRRHAAARADQDRGHAPDPPLHRARRPAGDPPRREGRRRGPGRRHRRSRARHPGHPGAEHDRGRGRRLEHPGADRGLRRGSHDRHPDPRRATSRCPRAPSCAPTPSILVVNVVAAPTEASSRPRSTPRAPASSRTPRRPRRVRVRRTELTCGAGPRSGGRARQSRARTTPRPGTTSASASSSCSRRGPAAAGSPSTRRNADVLEGRLAGRAGRAGRSRART